MTATAVLQEVNVMADADFARYVTQSGPRLKRLAYLLTGDLREAEDLLQTAYAKVLPRWDKIRDYDQPDAYMRRVMVNQRHAWWKRFGRHETTVDDLALNREPRDDTAAVDDHLALAAALRHLPLGQRRAVVLRHYVGLSEAETAETMGCSVGTVKSQTARGIAALRDALYSTKEL